MADFSKPSQIPEWADTGIIVEPSEAKKDSGWVAPELPPDTFFNWWQNLVGNWFKWVNERLIDQGGDPANFQIKSPPGVSDGGNLTLDAGDTGDANGTGGSININATAGGAAAGFGGDIDINAGDSTFGIGGNFNADSGDGLTGGLASIRAGSGSLLTGGDASLIAGNGPTGGGNASLSAGLTSSDGDGGTATVSAGAAFGVDRDGGDATLRAGSSTGDGFSNVLIRAVDANQGAGAASRVPQDYILCDGSNREIAHSRHCEFDHNGTDRGPIRLAATAVFPSSPQQGEIAINSTLGDRLVYYNGSEWESLTTKRGISLIDLNTGAIANFANASFAPFITIPANTLQPGSVIKFYLAGTVAVAAGTLDATYSIFLNGSSMGVAVFIGAEDGNFVARGEITIRTIGAGGTLAAGYDFGIDTTSASIIPAKTDIGTSAINTTAINSFELNIAPTAGGVDFATLVVSNSELL